MRKLLIIELLFSEDNISAFAYLFADSFIFDEFFVKENLINIIKMIYYHNKASIQSLYNIYFTKNLLDLRL